MGDGQWAVGEAQRAMGHGFLLMAPCPLPVAGSWLIAGSLARARQPQSIGPFLGWLGLAIAVVAVAGVVLLIYRRTVLAGDKPDAQPGLLDDLRAMRDRGELSPEEYDVARRALVARLSGTPAASQAPPVRKPVAPGAARVAAPGFDLTGAPLPRPPESAGPT